MSHYDVLEYPTLTIIVVGFAALACILLAEALLQWKYLGTDSKGGNAACVLFIFLFIAFVSLFQTRNGLP